MGKSTYADQESFVRVGLALTTFFLVDEGREDPNTAIRGPSWSRQRNAFYDGDPTLNAGVVITGDAHQYC